MRPRKVNYRSRPWKKLVNYYRAPTTLLPFKVRPEEPVTDNGDNGNITKQNYQDKQPFALYRTLAFVNSPHHYKTYLPHTPNTRPI